MSLTRFKIWKKILSSPKYLSIILISTIIFYLLNVIILQWSNLRFISITYILLLIGPGFYENVTLITFYSTIILGILTGFLISLLHYRYLAAKQQVTKLNFLASAGLFLGILAPGCASCGIGLIAVFGLSSTFISLPFQGAEISLISIIILGFTTYYVSNSLIKAEVCKIK